MLHHLLSQPVSLSAYLLLGCAVLLPWLTRRRPVWFTAGGLAILLGLWESRVQAVGVAAILGLGFLVYTYYQVRMRREVRWVIGLGICALAVALAMHLVPGFKNWRILGPVFVSDGAPPIRLYLNFDKPWVGFLLVAFGGFAGLRKRKDWISVFKKAAPVMGFAAVALLGSALALRYVSFDLKWPPFAVTWLLVNLLFTCVAEEAFFRGFLQTEIARGLGGLRALRIKAKHAPWVACVLASILFGLAHFAGGLAFVALASIAGFFYGMAYLHTGRLEGAILTHFFVNAVHFLVFSYPRIG